MGTAEVIKYLDDNQFGKKSYRELSAKSNKSVSLLLSDKTEAYDFDDITKYIFPKYTPSSADAILMKTNKIILIEFKGGFERKISEDNFDREKCRCERCKPMVKCLGIMTPSNHCQIFYFLLPVLTAVSMCTNMSLMDWL